MPTPVVTISCPACGGKVNGAELGERTACTYCGTELHLPAIKPTPIPPPPEPAQGRPNTAPALVAAIMFLVVISAMMWMFLSKQDPPPVGLDRPDPVVERAECMIGCTRSCVQLDEPKQVIACNDECGKRCGRGGRGRP